MPVFLRNVQITNPLKHQSSYIKTQQNSKKNDPVFKAPKSEDGSDIDLLRGRQEIMKVISALGGPVTS